MFTILSRIFLSLAFVHGRHESSVANLHEREAEAAWAVRPSRQ